MVNFLLEDTGCFNQELIMGQVVELEEAYTRRDTGQELVVTMIHVGEMDIKQGMVLGQVNTTVTPSWNGGGVHA